MSVTPALLQRWEVKTGEAPAVHRATSLLYIEVNFLDPGTNTLEGQDEHMKLSSDKPAVVGWSLSLGHCVFLCICFCLPVCLPVFLPFYLPACLPSVLSVCFSLSLSHTHMYVYKHAHPHPHTPMHTHAHTQALCQPLSGGRGEFHLWETLSHSSRSHSSRLWSFQLWAFVFLDWKWGFSGFRSTPSRLSVTMER